MTGDPLELFFRLRTGDPRAIAAWMAFQAQVQAAVETAREVLAGNNVRRRQACAGRLNPRQRQQQEDTDVPENRPRPA